MLNYGIEKAYREVRKRWPMITWPKEMYHKHVRSACSHADGKKAAFLEDIYLGGSAGYRLEPAWVVIHNDIAPDVMDIMSRRASGNLTNEELWSRALERLIDEDTNLAPLQDGRYPAKIVRYRGLVKLVNYCVTVANRIAIQNHKKRDADMSLSAIDSEQLLASNSQKPGDALVLTETRQLIVDTIIAAFKSLSREQRFLITMIYRQGMKQKQAAKMLDWSESRTTRQLAKAIDVMRRVLEKKRCIDFTDKVSDAFSSIWCDHFDN